MAQSACSMWWPPVPRTACVLHSKQHFLQPSLETV
jgi:hypothetical protein